MPSLTSLPKNKMEFWYLLLKECVTPVLTSLCTLGVVALIAQDIDTEWYAIGGAGLASFAGQEIKKKLGS